MHLYYWQYNALMLLYTCKQKQAYLKKGVFYMEQRKLTIFMNSGILNKPENFIKFAREIEKKINANDEIIKSVKRSNERLFEYIKK